MTVPFFKIIKEIEHFNCESLKFSPDSSFLVAGGDEDISIYDTENFELIETFIGHSSWINDLQFSN